MRTEAQNKQLWVLLTKLNLHKDDEARAKLAMMFSCGLTTQTKELDETECAELIQHLAFSLDKQLETMRRLRWRLWFAFAESKYEAFCVKGDKKKINYSEITAYCMKHWNKAPAEMSERELNKNIAIVTKWK